MFTIKNKPATLSQVLFFVIGNIIALPLCFWLLSLAGTALTGDVLGGYAFALFVAAMGSIVSLN